jgi:hypothetical protein
MSTLQTNQQNGLRTYRPSLSSYIFATPELKDKTFHWIDGVGTGTASRSLLLTGPYGLGKTSLALAVLKQLGCDDRDVTELNCGDTRKLEDARDLIPRLQLLPMFGKYRVLLLDEVHQLMPNAQQAFLTPIEKLPPSTILIGCTSDPELLNQAFRQRFYEIRLERYSVEKIVEVLENLPHDVKPREIAEIAEAADGNPRKAIALLEGGGVGSDPFQAKGISLERFIDSFLSREKKLLFIVLATLSDKERAALLQRTLMILEYIWYWNSNCPELVPTPFKTTVIPLAKKYEKSVSVISATHLGILEVKDKPLEYLKNYIFSL